MLANYLKNLILKEGPGGKMPTRPLCTEKRLVTWHLLMPLPRKDIYFKELNFKRRER